MGMPYAGTSAKRCEDRQRLERCVGPRLRHLLVFRCRPAHRTRLTELAAPGPVTPAFAFSSSALASSAGCACYRARAGEDRERLRHRQRQVRARPRRRPVRAPQVSLVTPPPPAAPNAIACRARARCVHADLVDECSTPSDSVSLPLSSAAGACACGAGRLRIES
jgi:hypothetical protein